MNYVAHLIITAGMSLMAVLGYNLIFGRGKVLHFGPVGIGLVTAYAIFLTERATGSYLPALLAGFLMMTVVSSLFAWMALRLEGDALGILTLATHLMFFAIILNWTDLTRGALGIPQIPRMSGLETTGAFAIVVVIVATAYAVALWFVDRSRLGRNLAALAESRLFAESLGISRASTTFAAFFIGGIGIFLNNVFFPQYIHLLHPDDYSFRSLIFYVVCIVAGGPGRVGGVTIATIVLLLLQESLRFVPLPYGMIGPVRLILFGVILIVAVYLRRKELFPQPRTV